MRVSRRSRYQDHFFGVLVVLHASKARSPARTKGTRRFPKDKSSARRSYKGVVSALSRRISLLCFFRGSLMSVGTGTTPSYKLRIRSVTAHNCSLLACRSVLPHASPPLVKPSRKGWCAATRHGTPLPSCAVVFAFGLGRRLPNKVPNNVPSPARSGTAPAAATKPLVPTRRFKVPSRRLVVLGRARRNGGEVKPVLALLADEELGLKLVLRGYCLQACKGGAMIRTPRKNKTGVPRSCVCVFIESFFPLITGETTISSPEGRDSVPPSRPRDQCHLAEIVLFSFVLVAWVF